MRASPTRWARCRARATRKPRGRPTRPTGPRHQRCPGQDEGPHQVGAGRRQAHRHPAAEGVADHHDARAVPAPRRARRGGGPRPSAYSVRPPGLGRAPGWPRSRAGRGPAAGQGAVRERPGPSEAAKSAWVRRQPCRATTTAGARRPRSRRTASHRRATAAPREATAEVRRAPPIPRAASHPPGTRRPRWPESTSSDRPRSRPRCVARA